MVIKSFSFFTRINRNSIITLYFKSMSLEPSPKRLHLKEKMKIGTHNGTFHCDEVLACYMLKCLPEYKDAEIIRTRDESLLATCDIVVDVGGVYDPSQHRYDHHQKTFKETMNTLFPDKPWVTPLSSAGLVYAHFGQRIIAQILDEPSKEAPIVQRIYDKVYEHFVEEIDGIDNGVPVTDTTPKYHISTHLSRRIHNYNPSWNEKNVNIEEQFKKAVELAGSEFKERIISFAKIWWPAYDIVRNAIEKRNEIDPSGEIIEFPEGGVPWKDHLFSIEEELGIVSLLKYAIFQDQNGAWRVQGVPNEPSSFLLRCPLPEAWRGLRGSDVDKLSGIDGCIFVHASGFIGGNETREGVLEMARKSLQMSKS